jgi:MFS family permease
MILCSLQAACALASGPVAAWPTLEPLLLDAGVWENHNPHAKMDAVFGVATAIQLITALPAGWIYDRYGGRAASLGGALMAGVGLVFMSAACYFPAAFSWLLFIGYPLAMLGGTINSYGIFAFMWLLPDDQNFISSMVGGAQALSDMLALVAVGLSSCCSFFIGDFFLALALLSVLAGLTCWLLVPAHDVVDALAAAQVSAQARSSSGEE